MESFIYYYTIVYDMGKKLEQLTRIGTLDEIMTKLQSGAEILLIRKGMTTESTFSVHGKVDAEHRKGDLGWLIVSNSLKLPFAIQIINTQYPDNILDFLRGFQDSRFPRETGTQSYTIYDFPNASIELYKVE